MFHAIKNVSYRTAYWKHERVLERKAGHFIFIEYTLMIKDFSAQKFYF
jgi:hypothetical protein